MMRSLNGALFVALAGLGQALRAEHALTDARERIQCSSHQSDAAQDDDWQLIAIVSGYDASGEGQRSLVEGLCSANFARRAMVVVLASNLGAATREPLKAQGHRVADEVLQLLSGDKSRRYTRYTLIGHSLGGLVGRLAATEIEAKKPNQARPQAFISLFSPHAGVQSFVGGTFLPSLLWLSGRDKGALKDLCEEDVEKSILVEMSRGSHHKAFERFEKRVLYSSHADWLVDFETGAIIKEVPHEEQIPLPSFLNYPLLGLRTSNASQGLCEDPTVRCEVLNAWRNVSFRRISTEWTLFRPDKHSTKSMSLEEQAELLRHITGELDGSNANLPRGSRCASGYCAFGLECSGTCQPKTLSEDACVADTDESRTGCLNAIRTFNHAVETWFLVVTSSGGGGHLVAAKNLQQTLIEELDGSYMLAMELLRRYQGSLKPHALKLAKAALLQVQQKSAVELVDLMKSPCTSLDGNGYISLGDFMTAQWNSKQQAGNIKGLKELVSYQPVADMAFGSQCRNYMKSLIKESTFGYQQPPTRLISTQPLFLQSLLDAAEDVSAGIDLYMTDLPTPEAVHFFGPLTKLRQLSSTFTRRLYLHTLAPSRGGVKELEKLSGVPQQQIKMEKFMPVSFGFTRKDELPSPETATAIRLKAQLPVEEEFLKGKNPVMLEAEDQLVLVMLGSQPTADAVRTYAEESLKLPERNVGRRFIFLACGRPSSSTYKKLYEDLVALARARSTSKTQLLPFTGQSAQQILGRADVTVTRSGGLTAGELLALHRRGDRKQVLLHVEPVEKEEKTRTLAGLPDMEDHVMMALAADQAALEGMVPWEVEEPFPVNWKLFLNLRGFNREARFWSGACGKSLEKFAGFPLVGKLRGLTLQQSVLPCGEGITIVRPMIKLPFWAQPECEGSEVSCEGLLAWRLP
ncbi:Putative lipase C4A8.10 [Durusdinium trenchii]|uniref:Lipase C4A8.10 n=1 Tax=Durusdinium trenchii TaxID=1381693 RepID=A0ABP0PMS2_9DINO